MNDPFLDFAEWRDELLNDASGEDESLAEQLRTEFEWDDSADAEN